MAAELEAVGAGDAHGTLILRRYSGCSAIRGSARVAWSGCLIITGAAG